MRRVRSRVSGSSASGSGSAGARPFCRAVRTGAGRSVSVAGPFALRPFEVGQTRAVDPLVHHPGRHQHVVCPGRRSGQRQGRLG